MSAAWPPQSANSAPAGGSEAAEPRARGDHSSEYPFRIVNVFAETPLAGNPLAVFEDARGLDVAILGEWKVAEVVPDSPYDPTSARARM